MISWLGAYFVKSEMYEKAIDYFQKAAQIQPKEVLPDYSQVDQVGAVV